jgi:hypothetical protein
MNDVDDTKRREEVRKRVAAVVVLIALVVFAFVWFYRY